MAALEHFDMTDRRAVVVAAQQPAGAAIARAYGEAGARLALIAPQARAARLAALRDALRERDVTSELVLHDDVTHAVEAARERLGGLDVLASCPDFFFAKPIGEIDDGELERVLAANFLAQFCAARAACRAMQEGADGRLVLVTHALGQRGLPNCSVYSAAHSATHGLVRALAQEMGPRGVSVNGIALGWMDWMDDRLDPTDEEASRAIRFTILKRAGQAEDIGPLAVWLSGSGAGYVTGQIFAADGGLLQHL